MSRTDSTAAATPAEQQATTRTGRAEPVTVLYVMGLFRSGSTILDIVLGNHSRLASVGELRSLPSVGWLGGGICACGEPAETCPFWSAVKRSWMERVGGDRSERLVELQDHFERIRSMPALIAGAVVGRSRLFREYCDLIDALYASIAQASGKSVIVDSTKYPGRALALTRTPGVNLVLLHLVRDGRAVIWSIHRKRNVDLEDREIVVDPEEVARDTTRQWRRVNALSALPLAMTRKSMRLRYEDFVSQPERELARVGDLLGVDFGEVVDKLKNGVPLDSGHMIAGNRVRHEGAVRLRADLEWREKLPEADRRVFWRMAGWLARMYGYRR